MAGSGTKARAIYQTIRPSTQAAKCGRLDGKWLSGQPTEGRAVGPRLANGPTAVALWATIQPRGVPWQQVLVPAG
jgi:hypothetical protein